MSWERRGNRYYYYYKFKSDGMVKSLYAGSGKLSVLIASWHKGLRDEQVSHRRHLRAMRARDRRLIKALKSIEQRLIDYYNAVQHVFHQSMESAGYYLHRRQWRKKGPITMPNRDQIPSLESIHLPPSPEAIGAQLRAEIAKRAFDDSQNPDALIEFHNGDPSRLYLERIMLAMCSDEHQLEAFRRKARKMREELEGPDPTPIERTLVNRIVICEFDVAYSDLEALKQIDYDERATAAFYDPRRHRAHKRLMSALKALATVRRLALPEMQARPNLGIIHNRIW